MPAIDPHPERTGINDPNVYFDEPAYSWVYRASAINNCSKQLIAFRMGFEGAPPPASMQARFDDGHLHEPAIMRDVAKKYDPLGWKVHRAVDGDPDYIAEIIVKEPDREAGVTGIIVRGHIDGLAINRAFNPDNKIVEAKALSKDNFAKFMRGLETGKVWEQYPYYRDQITIYMSAFEVPAIYAVKDKNSGVTETFEIDTPPGDLDELLSRVRVIDAMGKRDQLPDDCDRRSFPCPMWRLHDDEETADPDATDLNAIMADALGERADGGDWADLADLDSMAAQYDEFRATEKDAANQKKEMGLKIMESFLQAANEVKTENFTVKVKQHTYRYINKEELSAFLEQHGRSIADFEGERITEYPDVRKRRKK